MIPRDRPTTPTQTLFRLLLGGFMIMAALGHLTFLRPDFHAQVPNWVPLDTDLVVILSGVAELIFGLSMVFWRSKRVWVGLTLAVFFVLIFPGNIAQYVHARDAFGLDSDAKRLARLFFQPVLILWALWSTGALSVLRDRLRGDRAPGHPTG